MNDLFEKLVKELSSIGKIGDRQGEKNSICIP